MCSLWKNRRHFRQYPPLTHANFFQMETGILTLILGMYRTGDDTRCLPYGKIGVILVDILR